jgi:uncharacterized membrane protein HdeD (DUF308 family)
MSKRAGVHNNREVHLASTFGQLAHAVGELPRHWWVVALRGLAAIIFGLLAFIWPGITLGVLILFYGAYAIVDGVLVLYPASRSRGQPVWTLLLEGILSIGAGLVAFFWPAITALALLYLIGGVSLLAFAWRLRGLLEHMPAVSSPVSQTRPV